MYSLRQLFLLLTCYGLFTSPFYIQSENQSVGLQFLYQTYIGRLVRPLITNAWTSKCAGWLTNTSLSSYAIPLFIKHYSINTQEIANTNLSSYKTLNEFFIREIKPETRPFDSQETTIISPADGQIYVIESLQESTEFLVKGKPFDLARFIGNQQLAQEYLGGTLIVIYLAPHNYHRFHFPFSCWASAAQRIQGSYESVHSIAYKAGVQPLTENERHLIVLHNKTLQPVLCIPVGALCVGQITETYLAGALYQKAHQMGYFSFGGSTIALLFKKDEIVIERKFADSDQPQAIAMGQTIAKIIKK